MRICRRRSPARRSHSEVGRLVWGVPDGLRVPPKALPHRMGTRAVRRVATRVVACVDFRRYLVRSDRRDVIHEGLLALACCLICWRRLGTSLSEDLLRSSSAGQAAQ